MHLPEDTSAVVVNIQQIYWLVTELLPIPPVVHISMPQSISLCALSLSLLVFYLTFRVGLTSRSLIDPLFCLFKYIGRART
jgi:hypothetical protein